MQFQVPSAGKCVLSYVSVCVCRCLCKCLVVPVLHMKDHDSNAANTSFLRRTPGLQEADLHRVVGLTRQA